MSLREHGDISPREAEVVIDHCEQQPRLHPLQEFAVEANYVRGFFDAALKTSKANLPWLMQKEAERYSRQRDTLEPLNEKDVRRRYMYGLYDAYAALKADEKGIDLSPNPASSVCGSAVDRFHRQWGDMSYHFLDTVKGITEDLDEIREEQLANPKTIEPYDVHLAERRAKRFRATLPSEFRNLFTEQSGIDPDNLPKKLVQSTSTLLLSGASAYGVDAAALGSGSAGVALTADWAQRHLNGWGIAAAVAASYGSLAWGIGKNIVANMRLKKELGVNTNIGFAAGDVTAKVKGTDEETADFMGALGQAGGEIAKEVPWWAGLFSAKSVGMLNMGEVGVFVFWANLGGTGYSVAEAKLIHKFLDWRRGSYNRRHPFMEPVDRDFDYKTEIADVNEDSMSAGVEIFDGTSVEKNRSSGVTNQIETYEE